MTIQLENILHSANRANINASQTELRTLRHGGGLRQADDSQEIATNYVGCGALVVGRGSWVVGRGLWVVGRESWVVGCGGNSDIRSVHYRVTGCYGMQHLIQLWVTFPSRHGTGGVVCYHFRV